jgi:alpha-1,6-mannosyltransferase
MTVTPELEARPRTEAAPEARRGLNERLSNHGGRASRVMRAGLPWVRLAVVLVAALLSQLIYVFIWPLSYFMTQAADYTFEYLSQYPEAWERLSVMLLRFEQFWPGASRNLEFLVDALMQAFIGAFVLYLIVVLMARGGLPPLLGTVAIVAPPLAFHATLFAMPGLYTTDLFSYVMYSHIAGVLGVNPYTSMPSWFQDVRIFHWIHPLWANAPSIYGPAWIDLTLPLARAVATASEVDKVLAYKALVNVGHIAGVACLAYVVHRVRPGHVLEAVALYAWNPLIVFEFGGNGHNDAVMVSVMLLSFALYVTSARWLGFVALTVSMLLKMTSLFLMPFYVMAWAREQPTWLRFFGVGLLAGISAPIIVVAFYWPWWNGIETVGPIINWTQGPMFNNYTPDILAYYLTNRDLAAGVVASDPMLLLAGWRDTIKTVARVFFVIWCAVELWRVRGPLGIAGAGARVMLLFLLVVNTWVLPWYFSWPLALAIVVGWESTTAKVLVGFSLSAPTVMYYHHFWHPYMSDSTYLLYLAPLLIAPVAWIASFTMRRWRAWRRSAVRPGKMGRDGLAVVDVRS